MYKTIQYGMKGFYFAWKASGVNALVIIISRLYESTLYPFIQVVLLAKLIDIFTHQTHVLPSDLYWIFISYTVATVTNFYLRTVSDVKETYVQGELEAYIDIQISKKLTELDPATFESSEFQDLLAQLEGVKGTFQMHQIRFLGLIDAVFKFVIATIVVSVTFPFFAPLILIATIPSYLAWDRFRVITWPFYVEKRSFVIRITQYVKNLLSSDSTSKEAIIFKTGPILIHKIKKEQKKYFTSFDEVNKPWVVKLFITKLFPFIAFAYTQYLNLAKVAGGSLSIGQFALIFQQSLNLVLSSEDILNQYSSMSARNKYVDKFFEFLNTEKKIETPIHPEQIIHNPNPPEIIFHDVSFKYPKTERYILKNFNLTIKSGEKIALVGENGAGKTTLIKLLLRFYDVTDGEIFINGTNIKNVQLEQWHSYIGALFQDFIKYQFTFKENVYFGDLEKKKKEDALNDAINKSGAAGYLDNLPDKAEQVVGKMFDGGVDLSGGQWQKLALARAFFRNAPILVLDEPTSAIDAKAEYEIFEKVQQLQKDKTVIIISHRFSTVRNADRILVLDEGKIIEEGTHSKLMKKNGLYAELFNIQAQGYK